MRRAIKRVPDLRAQIFASLREDIQTGAIGADQRLTEMTVAKRYDVSRTPAREALALLSQAGLIVQDERGYRLPTFTREDVDEMFEVRRLFEPYAVRRIAEEATQAELKALGRFVNAELARSADGMSYLEANGRIRARLFALLRNKALYQLVTLFDDRLALVRIRTLGDPAVRRISVEGNRRLVAAVVARDPKDAERCMRYLLDEAQKATIASL